MILCRFHHCLHLNSSFSLSLQMGPFLSSSDPNVLSGCVTLPNDDGEELVSPDMVVDIMSMFCLYYFHIIKGIFNHWNIWNCLVARVKSCVENHSPNTRVVVIPSIDEACCLPIFPQPPMNSFIDIQTIDEVKWISCSTVFFFFLFLFFKSTFFFSSRL